MGFVITISSFMPSTLKKFKDLSNADIKRLFKQGAVKVIKDSAHDYNVLNTEAQLPLTLESKLSEFEDNDAIVIGNRRDINRIILRLWSTDPIVIDNTVYSYIIENKQDLVETSLDLKS